METLIRRHLRSDPESGIVSADLLCTSGKITQIVVDNISKVLEHHYSLIAEAKSEILLVSAYFDKHSQAFRDLVRTLHNLDESLVTTVQLKILTDLGCPQHFYSKRVNVSPRNLDLPTFQNIQVQIKSYHRFLLGTMHAKFLIIDNDKVIISSNNIQDRPNVEMSVEMCGAVVDGFVAIFWKLWKGGNWFPSPRSIEAHSPKLIIAPTKGGRFPPILQTCYAADGPQNIAWKWMIRNARSHIFIQTPTLNARALTKELIRSCNRGVTVTVYLTLGFNDRKENLPFQGGTNLDVVKRMYRDLDEDSGKFLKVHWFTGKGKSGPQRGVHCHVKYMMIDDEVAMFGNGNLDTLSVHNSLEINVVTFDKEDVKRFTDSLSGAQETHLVRYPQNTLLPGLPVAR